MLSHLLSSPYTPASLCRFIQLTNFLVQVFQLNIGQPNSILSYNYDRGMLDQGYVPTVAEAVPGSHTCMLLLPPRLQDFQVTAIPHLGLGLLM